MKKVLIGIFICLCSIILMSHNVNAIDITVPVSFNKGYFYPYWSDSNNKTWASGGYSYGNNFDYASSTAQYFRSNSNTAITASRGQFVSLTGAIVISVTSTSQAVSIQANPRQYFSVSNTSVDCPLIDITDTSFEQYQTGNTTWLLRYNFTSICRMTSNVTNNIAMNFNLIGGSTSGTDYIRFFPSYMAVWDAQDGFDDAAIISAISNVTSAINSLGNKIDGLADKFDVIQDTLDEQNNKEQEATENISDQTPSDISSNGQTENAQTTSLINVFGGFLSAISGVNTGSCIVQLPFPSYAGGTWNMNVCQNKDKAGNIVSLFGSATLVFFFLPVAWRLLGMIYNEIRSFTNG